MNRQSAFESQSWKYSRRSSTTSRHPRTQHIKAAAAAALALLTGIGLAGVSTPAWAAPPAGPVTLANVATGKCADLPGFGRGRVDGPVNQYDCRPGINDNQRWRLLRHSSVKGYPAYLIQNVSDGRCMDLPNFGRVKAGTPVSEYHCRAAEDNQLFYAKPGGRAAYYLVNAASDHCLDVAGSQSRQNDLRLALRPCDPQGDHLWEIRKTPGRAEAAARGATEGGGGSAGASNARVDTNGALAMVRSAPTTKDDDNIKYRYADGTPVKLSCQVHGDNRWWVKLASGKGYIAKDLVAGGAALSNCGGSTGTAVQAAKPSPGNAEPPGIFGPGAHSGGPMIRARGGWTENRGLCARNSASMVDEGEIAVDPEKHAEPWRVTQVSKSQEKYLETTTQKQVAVSRMQVASWCTNRTLPGGKIGQHILYRRYTPVEHVHRIRHTIKNCYATGCWGVPVFPSDWKPGTG